MNTSKYIAQLMGPLLLALGVGMALGLWAHPALYLAMLREFLATSSFIFVIGMLALVAGVAIVNAHNRWVADWPVIITILGWLAVIRGVISLVFPLRLHQMGEWVVSTPTIPMIGALITIALGAILTVMGYELWQPAPAPQESAKTAKTAKTAKARAPRKSTPRKTTTAARKTAKKRAAPAKKARTPRKRS
jgi:uncharacterized protein YacL